MLSRIERTPCDNETSRFWKLSALTDVAVHNLSITGTFRNNAAVLEGSAIIDSDINNGYANNLTVNSSSFFGGTANNLTLNNFTVNGGELTNVDIYNSRIHETQIVNDSVADSMVSNYAQINDATAERLTSNNATIENWEGARHIGTFGGNA